MGSIASFERRRHVCFTANYGRITATQRTDALGHQPTLMNGHMACIFHDGTLPFLVWRLNSA